MFSLATTMFYMLSAYVAFLIGSSEKLSLYLVAIVPIGFVAGYILDRLNSVKRYWHEDPVKIYKTIAIQYVFFLGISAVFLFAGLIFATQL